MAKAPAADPMAKELQHRFAPLTEEDIQEQTDSGSFSRGLSYFRKGNIFDPVLRGETVRAQCHGSSGGPYLVEATLAPADAKKANNPVEIGCDCPRGGFCKHIVALLLTWIHSPEAFEERPPIASLLAEKSREELIALVERMVKQAPDLEPLIELPIPVAAGGAPPAPGMAAKRTVDPASIRRQIKVAFRQAGDDYYAGSNVAGALQDVVELGRGFANAGQWANAVTVYGTLVEDVIDRYEEFRDDEGDLAGVIVDCDQGLADCLDAQSTLPESERLTPEDRANLLKLLFEIWRTDIDMGGIDLAQVGPDAIARNVSDDEREAVDGWLRAYLEQEDVDGYSRDWKNRAALGFVMMLKEESGLSDEELLEEYRAAELWFDVAETLLRLGRVEEATGVAGRKLIDYELIQFCNDLIEAGEEQVPAAIKLVEDRLWESEGKNAVYDATYQTWLEQQYAAHGMPGPALELARRRFKKHPDHATYEAVKKAAHLPSQPDDLWAELRPDLIKTLREGRLWTALIEVHLGEGEVGEALAALKASERGKGQQLYSDWSGWYGPSYHERVAQAAEQDYPTESIRLYKELAAGQIEGRQRSYYQRAAEYLRRVMVIYDKLGREDEWRSYITALREERKSLRALREELDSLGLR